VLWSAPQLYQRVRLQQRLADPRPVFEVADWLAANTEEGSLVLAPWSEFPMLFFRSLHNRYPFGLNPAYAWASDPRRTLMLRAFFEGRAADPLETPRALGARYAVLGRRAQAAALARLLAPPHPGAEVAYQNPAYVIVRVPAAGAR
jgi:hypothetical protein